MAEHKRADFDIADASSATQLVAGVAGKQLTLYEFRCEAANESDKAFTVNVQDDEATPIEIVPAQNLSTGASAIDIIARNGFIGQTTAAADLDIIASAANRIFGYVVYSEE